MEHFSFLADEGFGFCDVRAHLDVVSRQRPRTKCAHFEILLTNPGRLAVLVTHFVRVVHDAGALAEGHSSIAWHDLRHRGVGLNAFCLVWSHSLDVTIV